MSTVPAPLRFDFRFGFAARLRAIVLLTLHRPAVLVLLAVMPLTGLALAGVRLANGRELRWLDLLLITLCLTWIPGSILWRTWSLHRAARATGNRCHYEFGDFGVRTRSDTTEVVQSWNAFVKVKQRAGFLLLYFCKDCAHCLPAADLAAAGLTEPLLALARAHGVAVHGD